MQSVNSEWALLPPRLDHTAYALGWDISSHGPGRLVLTRGRDVVYVRTAHASGTPRFRDAYGSLLESGQPQHWATQADLEDHLRRPPAR